MTGQECDHCEWIIGPVKTFQLGRKQISICYNCACELMSMQNAVKEWVL